MVSGWKSAACRSTISETVCAKPSSRRPITFMGNTHEKVRSGEVSGSFGRFIWVSMPDKWVRSRPTSSRDGAGLACFRLVLLEKRVHAAKERPRPARAHGLAVERRDGEHFLGGRGEPDLVGRTELGLRDRADFELHVAFGREAHEEVVGDAQQYQ